MKWRIIVCLFASSPAFANNISYWWVGDGGQKLAQSRAYPLTNCSTCTIGPFWDGTNAKLGVAQNESRGIMLWLFAGGGQASSVTVRMSSLSGPSGASIANSASLPYGDTNYSQPIQEYYTRYLPISGESLLEWDASITEECDLPDQFRRPYTRGVLGNCVPNGGTLWTDRPDHDLNYPDILVPYTLVAKSSFTVAASSSQGVYFRIFAANGQTPGTYNATIDVKENNVLTISIPFQLTVYPFALPDKATIPFMLVKSIGNITYRHYGTRFPNYQNEPYYTTNKRYDQFIHMHRMIPMGDDNLTSDAPFPIDQARLSGALYQATTGYSPAAPAVGVGDPIYSMGTYGQWQNGWAGSSTSASGFCTHVNNWETWFKNNYPTTLSFLYLTDEPADLTNTNKWSTWMTTVTACQVSGYRTNSFVTTSWPNAQTNAPNLNMPATSGWIGYSTPTWKAAEANYETTGSTQAWAYNGGASYRGTLVTEDDGLGPTVIMWAAYKRGLNGWFNWESTYWTDSNMSGRDTNLFGSALTMGMDSSYDSIKGRTGFQYTNGEGVLMYPGTDVIGAVSYGFDGPMPSLRLERLTDALGDVEYLAKAKARQPTATAAIVNARVPEVLWEHHCYTLADCSYALGGRQWSNDPNLWEVSRQALVGIITGPQAKESQSFGGSKKIGPGSM